MEPKALTIGSGSTGWFRKCRAIPLALVSIAAICCGAGIALTRDEPAVHRIGSRRQLFLDSLIIGSMRNTRLELHHPIDRGPVFSFDRPWEGPFCAYCTVIKDGDLYRLYYRGMPCVGKDDPRPECTCYAESHDGLAFTRPDLGLFEVSGTLENNVILTGSRAAHNFSPFLDTRSGIPDSARFKALGGKKSTGLFAYVSGDGIRWRPAQKDPVFRKGHFDSQNVGFWSEPEQCYLCYFRTWAEEGGKRIRTVSRTASKDFLNWTEPEPMDFGDTPMEQLYTNQTHPYYRAPGIYIAVAARFMPGRQVLSEEQASAVGVDPGYYGDCSDAVLLSSRGGNRYQRTFMEGFITPGPGPENWVSRSNYPALNVVQTGPAEMSVYVNQNYAQPTAHLRRYSLRIDGFVSVAAPYSGGEMTTEWILFEGSRLRLNFLTSAAGEIRVAIEDENGSPAPGYTLEDCLPVIGNEIDRTVTWNKGEDVGELSGKKVRLRFVMKDAHLFSFIFQ